MRRHSVAMSSGFNTEKAKRSRYRVYRLGLTIRDDYTILLEFCTYFAKIFMQYAQ